MDDIQITLDEARFWKHLGIRTLRFFGVACTFFGYVIVTGSLFFGHSEESTLGWGLLALGIPHILAAQRLQQIASANDAKWARLIEPNTGKLFGTSLILPGICFGLVLLLLVSDAQATIVFHVYVAATLVWLVGITIIYFRRGDALTRWDRSYFRWGWLVLLGLAISSAMVFVRNR